jgi:hypothetical protein
MPDADIQKLKVFISYSRRDSAEFADELVVGLEDHGFAPFLDRHDIKPGESWEARLGGLIEQSDTIVFVISPESVKSERCVWEVDKALALSKRVLPVIYKSVPDAEIPAKLSKLQFVRFDTSAAMMRPLRALAEALRLDFDWIREHTRLEELAARWQSRNRPEALLLRGDDLGAAKVWATKRKPEAPDITELLHSFLSGSEQAEIARIAESKAARRRTRRMQILVGALAAIIVLGFAAYWNDYGLKMLYHQFTHVRGSVLTAEAERMLKPGEIFRECVKAGPDDSMYCPEMVVVPAGEFMMGSPATEKDRATDEGPQHEVTIAHPFAVSKFEVTHYQWDTCVQYGPCKLVTPLWSPIFGSFPVTEVNFYDASRYAAQRG